MKTLIKSRTLKKATETVRNDDGESYNWESLGAARLKQSDQNHAGKFQASWSRDHVGSLTVSQITTK